MKKNESLIWLFVGIAIVFAIMAEVKNDNLWFIRAGIVLLGGLIYYYLVKKKIIGKRK